MTYRCKKNKNVVLFSTLHPKVTIDNIEKKKPETVQFYNSTNFGVDVLDQMARKYSVKSSSRRWPVQVFFNILDLAAINELVLYKKTTGKSL
jgi:Transposase IS4